MDATVFPQRLRELRERAGLSQQQLADMVKMSPRQVSRLETGASVPSWPTVVALASALGINVAEFGQGVESGRMEKRSRGRPRKPPADPPAPAPAEVVEARKSRRRKKT